MQKRKGGARNNVMSLTGKKKVVRGKTEANERLEDD